MTKNDFLGFLRACNFTRLFLECGWNNPTTTAAYPIPVGEETYSVSEVAQKGLKIYMCRVAKMPEASVRRQIDAKLRKLSHDYFLIFVSTAEAFHHLWSVPVKSVDKRQLVTIEYVQDDQAAFLLEKVNAISFSFDEDPTIVDVENRVNAAFLVNTTDVTKKFYQGFRKQHDQFVKGIAGLGDDKEREWYASVMLNRLMFCYFVQKKGFLDFNENYLSDKLAWVQRTRGENKFDSFYRSFLRNLFSDGLNQPSKGRTKYFIKTYGRIPYLNGGMFAEHEIETRNRDIDIPDKVFEKLFAFFDEWHWHLDNRLTASGRDINPDVLGYIFEQYINDRAQMGAYYTKEDITEYIGRNCILPFLFSKVLGGTRFGASEKWIWDFLRASGDRYVFAAVKKGVELPLPDYIEIGVETSSPNLRKRRSRWNEKADEAYALPTEIWRETVARRQRYAEVRGKIEKGDITDIHDFITYNLDIRSFTEDILRETDDHHLVGLFYKAVREVTVLDPTCGSGAFLFAALNILEPLYEICLDRMEEFHAKNPKLFKDELSEIKDKFRSNQKYFIYKNIILRNLYGVDIMREATEIARLRLFLKMMAVVDVDPYDENLGLDPLPDIDFNVKCGNTLVGYASEQEIQDGLANGDMSVWAELKGKIDDELKKVTMAFKYFRDQQLDLNADNSSLAETKAEVKKRLAAIRTLLDDQLYDKHSGKKKSQWLADTQPFHWYTEFYSIMAERGGFDVIIGNPPYIKNSEVEKKYSLRDYETYSTKNVYTAFIERAAALVNVDGCVSFIVQLPLVCTDGMNVAQQYMRDNFGELFFATFDDRPGKLFDQLEHIRATIFIGFKAGERRISTSAFNRWSTEIRDILFASISYRELRGVDYPGAIAKIGTEVEARILAKLLAYKEQFLSCKDDGGYAAYYHNAPLYWVRASKSIPYFRNGRGDERSTQIKAYAVKTREDLELLLGVLNSSLFYLWFIAFSDTRHLNVREIERFPVVPMTAEQRSRLKDVTFRLMLDYEKHKERKTTSYDATGTVEYDEYHPGASKAFIDGVDCVLAEIYGLTDVELEYVKDFNYKFRMGQYLRRGV